MKISGAWIIALAAFQAAFAAPDVMLLEEYQGNENLDGWLMSEKLDGVRGYWDGQKLYSRRGYAFNPPEYFTRGFPPFALDGELYSARGEFEKISGIVRAGKDTGWSELKLHVFDVPEAKGTLPERMAVLEKYLQKTPAAHIAVIAQYPAESHENVRRFLAEIEAGGGEGVVVRNAAAPYVAGRSTQILKVKNIRDDECTVTAHHTGTGRNSNRMGALSCENRYGVFRVGSGFSDAERDNPPPLGSVITYRYRGFTKNGLPRFATFVRIRADEAPVR